MLWVNTTCQMAVGVNTSSDYQPTSVSVRFIYGHYWTLAVPLLGMAALTWVLSLSKGTWYRHWVTPCLTILPNFVHILASFSDGYEYQRSCTNCQIPRPWGGGGQLSYGTTNRDKLVL